MAALVAPADCDAFASIVARIGSASAGRGLAHHVHIMELPQLRRVLCAAIALKRQKHLGAVEIAGLRRTTVAVFGGFIAALLVDQGYARVPVAACGLRRGTRKQEGGSTKQATRRHPRNSTPRVTRAGTRYK